MIIQISLFLFLLLIIFLISKNIANQKFWLIEKIFGNRKISVWIITIIYLPGTIIHELSHFIVATILRVPTGPISILPDFDKGDSPAAAGQSPADSDIASAKHLRIRTGHVMVAKTDPIRMTLIGVAPMIVGLIIIYFLGNYLSTIWGQSPAGTVPGWFRDSPRLLLMVLEIYLVFITSITMFSSREDLKSLIITLPVLILIFSALYFTGIKIMLEENLLTKIQTILSNLNRNLIITGVIDYTFLVFLTIISKILHK